MDSIVGVPRISALESDAFLQNIMLDAGNQMSQFKETEICSNVPTTKTTGKYIIYPIGGSYGKKGSGIRQANGDAESLKFPITKGTYSLEERAFNVPMNNHEIDEYDGPQTWEIIMTRKLTRALLDLRAGMVTSLLDPTNLATLGASVITCVDATTDLTKTRLDISGSDPMVMWRQMVKNVRKGCGQRPNLLVMGFDIAQGVLSNAAFVDRFKYIAPTTEDVELPSKLRGMTPKVMGDMTSSEIPNKNDTAASATVGNLSDMWGNNMYAMYVDMLPSVESMTGLARYYYQKEPMGTVSWEWLNKKGRTIESWLYEEWHIPCPGAICCASGVLKTY